MKKFTKVYILGKAYKVMWCKKLSSITSEEDAYGIIDVDKNEIKVYDNDNWDDMLEWLLHEVGHAIESELNFDIGEKRMKLFSVGLADTLVRNKLVALDD